jgi:hypothetical protein
MKGWTKIIFSFYFVAFFCCPGVAQNNEKISLKNILQKINQRNPKKETGTSNQATVLFFISLDCPISQKYISIIEGIKFSFKDSSVSFTFILPGNIAQSDINTFKQAYASSLNFIKDKHKKLTKKLGATVTPEVFLLNEQYITLYHGAIDNWFFALGRNRPEATETYLIDALKNHLHNQNISAKFNQPIGCLIEY